MKTFASAYVNLLKTSIGSGVLSFPFLFNTYGIVLGVLFTFISGFLATIGLVLLTICSQDLGRSADLSRLASVSIPYSKMFMEASVFAKCFGVSLSYVIITKQLLPQIISSLSYSSVTTDRSVYILGFLFLVGPFAYFSKLDKLKYTSFIGVFCIVTVILSSLYRLVATPVLPPVHYFRAFNSHWITGFGKFIFSFTCHQNIFSVNTELVDNSLSNMKKLITYVSLSSFTLYISFGWINFALYSDSVTDNVLKNYPSDLLATIVRILYVVVMGVSYPLQMAPARKYLLNMLHISNKTPLYRAVHVVVTTLLIMLTYFIAVSGAQLNLVYSIIGSTASCFMCLIFPALFYLNLDIERSKCLTISAYLAFLIGVFIFISTTYILLTKK